MCQGAVEFEVVSSAWMIDFARYFAAELRALQPLAQEGLLDVDAQGIRVSDKGWFFVRAIAMVFDSYLQEDLSRERFSRIL
jgi:oxygen-independent coproporphyrinogen-3 oxidase